MDSRIVVALLAMLIVPQGLAAPSPGERFAVGWQHYEKGRYERAADEWRIAAGHGHAGAQLNLGLLYEFGQGVAPDPARAARWYASAARLGLSAARTNLAAMRAVEPGAGEEFAARHVRSTPWDDASVGSGWPVSASLVVTNHHVIDGSRDVVLVDSSGREIAAQVVHTNRFDDLALLRVVDGAALPPALPLAAADAPSGSRVLALGYPRIDVLGHSPKTSVGAIAEDAAPGSGPRSYRLDMHIEPGYSGGPLLNARGEVVGTVTGMLGLADEQDRLTGLLENAGVAVRLSAIRETLAAFPGARAPAPAPLSRRAESADVERIGASVLVVVAR